MIVILFISIILTVIYIPFEQSQQLTFAECEKRGGVVWNVDVFHPDICPFCAEYQKCETEYNDYSDVCPQCYDACPECQNSYSLYESCPTCYGPCQRCQNKYLHQFENEEQKYKLCLDCKKCDKCREQLNEKVESCPPCISCNECKQKNKKYTDIRNVCPSIRACPKCIERNSPYPDKCPNGRKKIGEISDSAIWHQCCQEPIIFQLFRSVPFRMKNE